MRRLTESLEDYLECIYVLEKTKGVCRITDISDALSISKASANKAVNSLKRTGLLIHEKYGTITLTTDGIEIAREVYSKHVTLKKFFTDILGVENDIAEKEACSIEHVMSMDTLEKLVKYLNLIK